MKKWWPGFVQWLLVLLLPVLLLVANLRVTNGHWFVHWEYGKSGFPPDGYGFTTAERTYLAEVCVDYLVPGAPISLLADLRLPNGEPAFNQRELDHMEDVQSAFTQMTVIAAVGTLAWIGGFIVLAYSRQTRRRAATTLLAAGLFILVMLLVMGAVMLINWWEFFTVFHSIFFEEGTWVFQRTDTLIRLFPIEFWMDVAVVVVVLMVVEAVVLVLVGWLWRRRIKTRLGLQD